MVCYQSAGKRYNRFCDTSNMPLQKKVDMKYMRVNVLKNIARVARRLCTFIMSHTYFRVNLLCSCVNVKELLARKRRDIWRWIGCHGIQTHNYLASKLAKMVKWLNDYISLNGWVFFTSSMCFWIGIPFQWQREVVTNEPTRLVDSV